MNNESLGSERNDCFERLRKSSVKKDCTYSLTNGERMRQQGGNLIRKRFTIIELLVVIGIIAILAGMLLPVLGKVRATATKISCLNNMKQVGTDFTIYADDNSSIYPFASCVKDNLSWGPQLYGTNTKTKQLKYVRCPYSRDTITSEWYVYGAGPNFGVSYRNSTGIDVIERVTPGFPNTQTRAFIAKRCKKPGSVLLLLDTIVYSGTHKGQQFCKIDSGKSSGMHFRHGRMMNTSWLDGHAESVTPAQIYNIIAVQLVRVQDGGSASYFSSSYFRAENYGVTCYPR